MRKVCHFIKLDPYKLFYFRGMDMAQPLKRLSKLGKKTLKIC